MRNGSASYDKRTIPNFHRSNQIDITADERIIADFRYVFVEAVIIHRYRAATDVHV
ncbi:hypothetical protein D3C85_1480630 [compost metagenome]